MRFAQAIVVIGLVSGPPLARPAQGQEAEKDALGNDYRKLAEVVNWVTPDWRKPGAEGVQISLQVGRATVRDKNGLSFSLSAGFERGAPGETLGGFGAQVRLQEADGKRWIDIGEALAKGQGLPRRWSYRLDGDTLVLKLDDGRCEGVYRLKKRVDP